MRGRLAAALLLASSSAYGSDYSTGRTFGDLSTGRIGAVQLKSIVSTASVTTRAPLPTDDGSHGYAVGNLWNVPGLGMWICADATVGAAVWSPVPTGILPLDSVPGVVLHGWGTRRLRAAYTGNPLAVTIGSTATDVGFDATGNLDSKTLAALLGTPPAVSTSSGPQMWSAAVTTEYDQTSGTAANMTVPSGAVAPQISPLYRTGGSPFVGYADGGMNWLTDYTGTSNIQHPRLATAASTTNAQNMTVQLVLRNGASGNALNSAFAFTGQFPIALNVQDITIKSPLYAPASLEDGSETSFGFYVPSSPSVLGMNGSASALTAFDDDAGAYSGAAPLGNAPTGGMVQGGADASTNGFAVAISAAIEGPSLTPAQTLALRESLTDTFQLTPQVRDRAILAGASTDAGADGWMTHSPFRWAEASLKKPMVMYNLAIAGSQTGNGAATAALTLFPEMVAPLYRSYALNVLMLGNGSGVNSLGTGQTPAQTIADWQTWMTEARALGGNVRIVATTLMPHGSIPSDAIRQQYNALVRSRAYAYDVLDDLAASPVLGSTAILTDRTYTVPGGGHHSPYYQSMEGLYLGAALNAAASK